MVFCNDNMKVEIIVYRQCHNPYFNRWFSAINNSKKSKDNKEMRHNPYFNRWFSAIKLNRLNESSNYVSQSLF